MKRPRTLHEVVHGNLMAAASNQHFQPPIRTVGIRNQVHVPRLLETVVGELFICEPPFLRSVEQGWPMMTQLCCFQANPETKVGSSAIQGKS